MIPDGMQFRAVRVIPFNGVIAYNPGDLVHESAVEGPGAWLALGTDVEPVEGARLDVPPRNAPQAAWAAYMTSTGMDADEAAGMSRQALMDARDAAQASPVTAVTPGVQAAS